MSITRTAQTATKPQDSGGSALLLQRKCACGGSAGLTGECEGCRTKRLLGQPLQAKLRINEPGDAYEQEADRVADQVMRMPDAPIDGRSSPSAATPLIQRKVSAGNAADVGGAPPIVQDVLSSPGEPLGAATRAFFEPRFGHDFSSVRVHTGEEANKSTQYINARAYTIGSHIVFGKGESERETGNRLLAHELAHVLQQFGGQGTLSTPINTEHDRLNLPAVHAIRAVAEPALMRWTDESLGFQAEWRAKSPEERQRIMMAGPGYDEIKKAGYDALIESARAARQSYTDFLRATALSLPPEVQPAALSLVDVADAFLQTLTDVLLLQLGFVVGFGEGLAQMVSGVVKIFYTIVALYMDALLTHLALPSPFLQEREAFNLAVHNLLYLDPSELQNAVLGFLNAWLTKFQEAPREERALMVGEFLGAATAELVTWQATAAKLGRLRLPPLGPGASPQLVGAVAGGGSIALQAERGAAGLLLGPKLGGAGAAVTVPAMSMAGKGSDDPKQGTRESQTKESKIEQATHGLEDLPTEEVIFEGWGLKHDTHRIGIVHTSKGPRAWYIRTGRGGAPRAGEPGAGDAAPFFGIAYLQRITDGRTLKWFIKPGTGGRVGEESLGMSRLVKGRVATMPDPDFPVEVTDDLADITLVNQWLQLHGVEVGGWLKVGEIVPLPSGLYEVIDIPK